MANRDLRELMIHQLKDTYYAENAIVKALPRLQRAARSRDLKSAFGVHLEETEQQIERLNEVFELLDERPQGMRCEAIEGIIAEAQDIIEEFGDSEAIDAGLIAAAQAVEHYEITRYGTLLAWARQLGLEEVEDLIKETLIEEENTDEILSELAEDAINEQAMNRGRSQRSSGASASR